MKLLRNIVFMLLVGTQAQAYALGDMGRAVSGKDAFGAGYYKVICNNGYTIQAHSGTNPLEYCGAERGGVRTIEEVAS